MQIFPFVIEVRDGRDTPWFPYLCFSITSGVDTSRGQPFSCYTVCDKKGHFRVIKSDPYPDVRMSTLTVHDFLAGWAYHSG